MVACELAQAGLVAHRALASGPSDAVAPRRAAICRGSDIPASVPRGGAALVRADDLPAQTLLSVSAPTSVRRSDQRQRLLLHWECGALPFDVATFLVSATMLGVMPNPTRTTGGTDLIPRRRASRPGVHVAISNRPGDPRSAISASWRSTGSMTSRWSFLPRRVGWRSLQLDCCLRR